jgi:hypothetical protein
LGIQFINTQHNADQKARIWDLYEVLGLEPEDYLPDFDIVSPPPNLPSQVVKGELITKRGEIEISREKVYQFDSDSLARYHEMMKRRTEYKYYYDIDKKLTKERIAQTRKIFLTMKQTILKTENPNIDQIRESAKNKKEYRFRVSPIITAVYLILFSLIYIICLMAYSVYASVPINRIPKNYAFLGYAMILCAFVVIMNISFKLSSKDKKLFFYRFFKLKRCFDIPQFYFSAPGDMFLTIQNLRNNDDVSNINCAMIGKINFYRLYAALVEVTSGKRYHASTTAEGWQKTQRQKIANREDHE